MTRRQWAGAPKTGAPLPSGCSFTLSNSQRSAAPFGRFFDLRRTGLRLLSLSLGALRAQ
jgi:hypothetical protein